MIPKVLLFRVDVLTSLEGQRVIKYVHSILDLPSLVSKKMKIVSALENKVKSAIMTKQVIYGCLQFLLINIIRGEKSNAKTS